MDSVEFLRTLFEHAQGPVFLTALPSAREIFTRKPGDVIRFIERNDIPGQDGVYVCPTGLDPLAELAPGERSLRSKRNAVSGVALWADIDAKDIRIGLEDAATILRALRIPPSLIVWSGNGLHAYWLLTEPFDLQADLDGFEAALRRLVDRLGADPAPAHAAALMRLPGTHNRKRGADTLVTVEGEARRYHFEDLEDWLEEQPVVLARRTVASRPVETDLNPFLAAAREHGWKPTLDVDGELARMAPGNIHLTCVRVSASLLMRGVSAADVVARLLGEIERVKAAAGERFNARREERKLAGMCRSWVAKHPVEHRKKRERVMDEPGEVHEYEGARAKKKAPEREPSDKASLHVALGEGVLSALQTRGDAVLFTPKAMWHCHDGLWSIMPREEGRGIFDPLIEEGCTALGVKSTNRLANEARGWISRQPALNRHTLDFDRHSKIPTRSGLLDPETFEQVPLTQDRYCTWRVETDYDPSAQCPWWLRLLEDLFADRNAFEREENIRVLQEIAGCALIDAKPREMAKGLIILGSPNTGKSGIIEVLSGLFGTDPITARLDSIDGTHGLMPFVRRAPWALHEAFEQSKWHFSANVKTIITGEPFSINIKNGPIVTVRYRGPLFWGTNYAPQFKEATRAVIERFVILETRVQFDPKAPRIGAALEAARLGFSSPAEMILAREMPGVLNWALDGYKRARAAGRITLNTEGERAREEIHRDSNLVAGFIEDCISFDPGMMVAVPDFYAAFCAWWSAEKGSRTVPERKQVGKALSALGDARIATHDKELRTNAERFYAGIILNDAGIKFHKQSLDLPSLSERTASAARDGVINQDIPGTWDERPSVIRMRAAGLLSRRSDALVTSCHFEPLVTVFCDKSAEVGLSSPTCHAGLSPAHPLEKYEEDSF